MGTSDSLMRPDETSFPYIHRLSLKEQASPRVSRAPPHGYSLRVTPATPEACLSVLAVIVKTDMAAFP